VNIEGIVLPLVLQGVKLGHIKGIKYIEDVSEQVLWRYLTLSEKKLAEDTEYCVTRSL
jgi:hypothetical protein